ncbi:hypothetical protein [Schlesneria paludicola]|uniref:hypothetical protein n=1 Tax=Schlesneria paludicola TaxID=360056 RepID=UPI00029AEB9E|nr:hypothetical protein [Schlesneria paludicola]
MAFLRWRRWWPWNWSSRTWLFAIVLGLLASPFVSRWICLWQVPDIAVPFDIESVIRAEVPPEEDAFAKYVDVVKSLRQFEPGKSTTDFDFNVSHLEGLGDARFNQWLIDRRDILAEYQAAGAMPQAGGPSLKTADYNVPLSPHQDFRGLVRFAIAEASLYEREGNLDQAWACYLAGVRSGVHVEQPGFALCCLIGSTTRSLSYEGVSNWASHSVLKPEQLRTARRDIATALTRRVRMSDMGRVEYIVMRNSARDPELANQMIPHPAVSGPILGFKRFLLWCVGEPELSLRLERQCLVNRGTEPEKPKHIRRKQRASTRLVFELDPQAPRQRGQLDAISLVRAIESTFPFYGNRQFYSADLHLDLALQRGDARATMIMVLLAAQEYQRIHGEFPELLAELVPDFLNEIPFDPMDVTGAPIRYRREAHGEAIVWSIGQNEVDDDGNIDSPTFDDIGYHIRVKPLTEATTDHPSRAQK